MSSRFVVEWEPLSVARILDLSASPPNNVFPEILGHNMPRCPQHGTTLETPSSLELRV